MHSALLADVGVPMLVLQWPFMICALLPVIAIEAEVIRRRLSLTHGKAFAGAARANLISTLIGVPVAWAIMLLIEIVVGVPLGYAAFKWHWQVDSPLFYLVFAAWAGPPIYSWWPIALSAAVLLIPTFFVSVRFERRSYRRSYPQNDPSAVDHSVWLANLCSYGLLFAVACGWLGWEIHRGAEKAPVTKRTLQDNPVDRAYLHEVAIPSSDGASRPHLTGGVTRLEAALDDFHIFMRGVEDGKIAIRKNLGRGFWESVVNKPGSWMKAQYADRLGPVISFRKDNLNQFIFSFEFNQTGYITEVSMPPDDFLFDAKGRLTHWHREKWDYWGHPGK